MVAAAAGFGGAFFPVPGGRGVSRRNSQKRTLRCNASSSSTGGSSSGKRPVQAMIPGLGIAISATAGLAALVPTLGCSQLGLKAICSVANALLGPELQVSIDSASFSWTSPQWLKGIVIRDGGNGAQSATGQRTFVAIDELALHHGLLSMAFTGRRDFLMNGLIIDPAMDNAGMSLLAIALARSRLGSSPVCMPESSRAQLAEMRLQAESAGLPITPSPEQAPVVFDMKADTVSGRSAVQQGTIWLPMEAADLLGGPVSVLCSIGALDGGHTTVGREISVPQLPESTTRARSLAELAQDADNRVQTLLKSLQTEAFASANEQPTTSKAAAVAIESNNLVINILGWLHGDGQLELARPAHVTAALSPAPARRALARISPLLGSVVPSNENDAGTLRPAGPFLNLQLAPESAGNKLLVPSGSYIIKLDPLKVSLQRSQLLDNLLWLMEKKPELSKSGIVPAWLAETRVKVAADGSVKTDRVDMQIAGMHVCTWGQYDPITGLDVVLGFPAATMGRILLDKGLKLKRLHPDYVFQIQVKGPLQKPSVNWQKASSALIALGLKLQAEGLAKSSSGAAGRFFQSLVPLSSDQLNNWLASLTTAPILTVDLPWHEGNEVEQVHNSG